GRVSDFQAQYHDIVQDRRIVYSYSMHIDDKKISVSLATIEFEPAGKGTKLVLTEQGAFLDGYDDAGSRERGTGSLLDALEKSLGGAS
ncbi:MAG TPA: SRPBCC domain-containing protein, partial [Opitutaceae bacterium]